MIPCGAGSGSGPVTSKIRCRLPAQEIPSVPVEDGHPRVATLGARAGGRSSTSPSVSPSGVPLDQGPHELTGLPQLRGCSLGPGRGS